MTNGTTDHTFLVTLEDRGHRLDRFLAAHMQPLGISREKIKQLTASGKVHIGAQPCLSPKKALRLGDSVSVDVPQTASRLTPESGDIDILYQDAFLAVVNKPAGLTVHPCPSCTEGTLAHRLVAHFPELAAQEGFRPGIVHRIDKDTSGLLLVALTEKSRLALSAMFAARTVQKNYLALVHGVPRTADGSARGTIDAPIGRHPTLKVKMAVTPTGKPAHSDWRVVYAHPDGLFSLLNIDIHTGRTHQIRVHMSHIRHPLWGDPLYTAPPQNAQNARKKSPAQRKYAPVTPSAPVPKYIPPACAIPRQMLHAWKLGLEHPFPHPAGSPLLRFICPPPNDFFNAIRTLASQTLRVVVTGSPGCGKSTLLSHLAALGIPTFSADDAVAALYGKDGDGQRLLRARFGDRFVPHPAAPVDKALLGTAMRECPTLRQQVEELLHPLVRHNLEAFWQTHEAAGTPVAVAEIPLYLEARFDPHRAQAAPKNTPKSTSKNPSAATPSALFTGTSPFLVGVESPFALRKKRLRARGWSDNMIDAVEAWQLPEKEKLQACDIVVQNTGTQAALLQNATSLLKQLEQLRQTQSDAVLARICVLIEAEGTQSSPHTGLVVRA